MENSKLFKCPIDGKTFTTKQELYTHLETEYSDQITKSGVSIKEFYFKLKNPNKVCKSMISGKPTKFNEITEKCEPFLNEEEKQEYVKMFKERMKKKYGAENLLNNPEQQKKMLNNRGISFDYRWRNGECTKVTSKYEFKFLEYIEHKYGFKKEHIAEAPTIYYKDGENVRFYLPDFFIPSLNLIIEIKGDNNHYQQRDEYMESLKKEAAIKEGFEFIQLNNGIYNEFNIFILNKVGN